MRRLGFRFDEKVQAVLEDWPIESRVKPVRERRGRATPALGSLRVDVSHEAGESGSWEGDAGRLFLKLLLQCCVGSL